jgi:hypothetical protein
MSRTKTASGTAIACCLVLAVAATPALAKKKHKKTSSLGPVVTATGTGPTVTGFGAKSAASASCPAGLQAVGGGFSAPFNSAVQLVVTESYRSSFDTWHVTAHDASGGAGAAIAFAYCRRNNRVITDVSATGTVPAGFGQNAKVEADCPPGVAAISGGFQIAAGPGASDVAPPMSSIGGGPVAGGTPPVGNWQVTAQNDGFIARSITTHVYCMAGIKVPTFRQDQGSAVLPFLGSFTEASSCPPAPKVKKKGKKRKKKPAPLLSAGAFYSPFIPGSTSSFPIHTDSRIGGSAFIDTVANGGSGGTITAQSQAMCF